VITNERARVRADAAIRVVPPTLLRGELKLGIALDALRVDPTSAVAVDLGAAAGGFTSVLLRCGARRVYAVDVGHGQLLGRLRQDDRVINLERTNVADLSRALVPDAVDLITMDLSYLPVAEAVRQLQGLDIANGADLVALVKPTFELRRARLASDSAAVRVALSSAADALERHGWAVIAVTLPTVMGAHGAVEGFIHAQRTTRS
jgi:23S rRNA (cytidine1920-2'-O)/16S rRNA (cytidine1409-2'-O)-methyltransferase